MCSMRGKLFDTSYTTAEFQNRTKCSPGRTFQQMHGYVSSWTETKATARQTKPEKKRPYESVGSIRGLLGSTLSH